MSASTYLYLNFRANTPEEAEGIIKYLLTRDKLNITVAGLWSWDHVGSDLMCHVMACGFPEMRGGNTETEKFHQEYGSNPFLIELYLSYHMVHVPYALRELTLNHPNVAFEAYVGGTSMQEASAYLLQNGQVRSWEGSRFFGTDRMVPETEEEWLEQVNQRAAGSLVWVPIPEVM